LGLQGINKDSSACAFAIYVVSPHNDFHKPAANAAHAATAKYFKHVRSLLIDKKGSSEGEALFKQFLGFGSEIGFAIDTTGSMYEEIAGVRASAKSIVQKLIDDNNAPSKYVLSIISDPTVPAPLVTTDAAAFLDKLSSLYVGGGGDCPELSGLGTYKAVVALGESSELFVYTDASVKDPGVAMSAAVIANLKKIKINNSLSGSCSPYDAKYFEMSELTGGQVFIIKKSEAGNLSELSSIMLGGYYTPIATIGGALTSTSGNKSYEFKVDSKVDKLSAFISITSGSVAASIVRPDGSVVDINDAGVKRTALTSLVVYEIANPQVGEWKLNISGKGEFTINVAGNTSLSFDNLKFVEYDNRSAHAGFFAIEGFPVAGSTSAIEATLSDVTSDVSFELRSKSGEVLSALKLDVVDEYPGVKTVFLKEDFVVPNEDFIVYAFGKDANGKAFQRVMPQKVAPQTVSIETIYAGNIPLNANTTHIFRVTNSGNQATFKVDAVDDKGYVLGISTKTISLETGEYADVNVILNPGNNTTAIGAVSTLTFTVVPASADKIGNYAVVEATVTKEKQHQYPWYRPLKLRNIQP